MRILIADDDEDIRELLVDALEARGHTVAAAPNGREALDLAMADPPDLIVSDILMPEMDGFDFCRAAKSRKKLEAIPFVFLSGTFFNPKDRNLANALGVARFLMRPLEIREFIDTVEEVMAEHGGADATPPETPRETAASIDEMHAEVLNTKLHEKVEQLEDRNRALQEAERNLRKNYKSAEILGAISRLALSDRPLRETMGEALDLIMGAEEFNWGATGLISLLDDTGNRLDLVAERGCSDGVKATCSAVPLGKCLCGLVAESREPIFTPSVDHTHEVTYEGMEPHGHCCVPIVKEDELLGVLNLYVPDGYVPTEDERIFVTTIADTIAGLIERKRKEAALQTTVDELSRVNTELERFAFVAAHDLQEPVRNVTNYVQRLQKSLAGRLDDDEAAYLSFVRDGAVRIRMLVSDLLSYTQVATHEAPFHAVDLNLAAGVAEMNMRGLIAKTGAEIVVDTLPTVRGEQSQLTLLFQNLLGNALKFRREDEPPVVEIDVRPDSADWVFSVKDNGIGIEAQYFRKIFEVFKRLHTLQAYPGTGIGLSMCRRIVERHGGRIWVESEPGAGSTFFFTLPAGK